MAFFYACEAYSTFLTTSYTRAFYSDIFIIKVRYAIDVFYALCLISETEIPSDISPTSVKIAKTIWREPLKQSVII